MHHLIATLVATLALLLPLQAFAGEEAVGAPAAAGTTAKSKETAAPADAAAATAKAEAPERWVGHQVVVGKRKVPLIGSVHTRTDSFFLATVERGDGRIRLEMQTCKSEIAEAAGVQVSFPAGVEPRLPVAEVEFREGGSSWQASFESGWGEEDIDGDGHPGVTMQVEAPLCSGKLHVASRSRTRLRGRMSDDGLAGDVQAISQQKTLGADSACLRMMAKDEKDSVRGHFAWAKAPADATCERLLAAPWPVKAQEPRAD